MHVFFYDNSFEGLLSAVFDAYTLKVFPGRLLGMGEIAPLLTVSTHNVMTRPEKWARVFTALEKKLSPYAFADLLYVNLSEQKGSHELLFRYICKVFDAPRPEEMNLADSDVLEVSQLARKVGAERQHMLGFARFQKTTEGSYFATVAPRYNVVPLMVAHFKDRFADQKWIIYDVPRGFGIYFDMVECREVYLDSTNLQGGKLNDDLLEDNEKLFQNLWKSYCAAVSIQERSNPKLQRRCMPKRFWSYLTEKH